ALVRRKGRMLSGLVGMDAHRAEKRPEGDLDSPDEGRLLAAAELEDLQVRGGGVVRQQAEAWDDRRPAPWAGTEREHLDLERIPRLRTLDVDRSAQVVDRVEVPDDVLRLRRLLHLALAGHQEV